MHFRLACTAVLAVAALGVRGEAQPADTPQTPEQTELRIATLAPHGSSWMRVLNAWHLTIQKETTGALTLRF